MEFKKEVQDEKRVSEIYVRVSSIAERLQVHRQIEVVKSVLMPLANHIEQIFLAESHGDVANHQRRQAIFFVQNCKEIDLVAFKRVVDGLWWNFALLLFILELFNYLVWCLWKLATLSI